MQYKIMNVRSTHNVRLCPSVGSMPPRLAHNASRCQRALKTLRILYAITARKRATIATSTPSRKSQKKAQPIRYCRNVNGLSLMQ